MEEDHREESGALVSWLPLLGCWYSIALVLKRILCPGPKLWESEPQEHS